MKDEEEEMMKSDVEKKEMVKTGKIEDLKIFKLMFLEKSINEVKLLSELKKRAINDQIEQLKAERQSHARSFELRAKNLSEEVLKVRSMFEDEYGIKLSEWGYDDMTGVLVPLNPDVLNEIHSREALQKEVNAERSEVKKKRLRRKIKKKDTEKKDTEQVLHPEAESEDVAPKPPAD